MPYIKSGIVTRIEIINNYEESLSYIKKIFNLKMYEKIENIYLLKEEILSKNIWNFREEYLKLSNNNSDSLDNCEAYCLQTNINNLKGKRIYLKEKQKKYYFEDYENISFETDSCILKENRINIKIFFIPIFWDTNKITIEDFTEITTIVNNLTRLAMKNKLKDASWFTII